MLGICELILDVTNSELIVCCDVIRADVTSCGVVERDETCEFVVTSSWAVVGDVIVVCLGVVVVEGCSVEVNSISSDVVASIIMEYRVYCTLYTGYLRISFHFTRNLHVH